MSNIYLQDIPSLVVEDEKIRQFIKSIAGYAGICGYEPEKELNLPKELSDKLSDNVVISQVSKRPRKMPQYQIQFDLSTQEMRERINKTIEDTRNKINESNKVEFLASRDSGAARTSEPNPNLNRKEQIQLGIVDNKYGPLNRTNNFDIGDENKLISEALAEANNTIGLETRISDIEDHLGLSVPTSQHKDLYVRVKCIENFIVDVEEKVPEIARMHFKAHQTENRSKGTSSTTLALPSNTSNSNQILDGSVKVVRAADGSEVSDEDSEEEEMKDSELNKKISELKKSLLD